MKKKMIAIILEIIPVMAAILSYVLVLSDMNSSLVKNMISAAFLLAFLGFVFFFIGRGLAKDSKAVRILGIFDWLATVSIIVFYCIAIIAFGL